MWISNCVPLESHCCVCVTQGWLVGWLFPGPILFTMLITYVLDYYQPCEVTGKNSGASGSSGEIACIEGMCFFFSFPFLKTVIFSQYKNSIKKQHEQKYKNVEDRKKHLLSPLRYNCEKQTGMRLFHWNLLNSKSVSGIFNNTYSAVPCCIGDVF